MPLKLWLSPYAKKARLHFRWELGLLGLSVARWWACRWAGPTRQIAGRFRSFVATRMSTILKNSSSVSIFRIRRCALMAPLS